MNSRGYSQLKIHSVVQELVIPQSIFRAPRNVLTNHSKYQKWFHALVKKEMKTGGSQ